METGKIINRISNRLRRRAQAVQNKLGIGTTQGNISHEELSCFMRIANKMLQNLEGNAAANDVPAERKHRNDRK